MRRDGGLPGAIPKAARSRRGPGRRPSPAELVGPRPHAVREQRIRLHRLIEESRPMAPRNPREECPTRREVLRRAAGGFGSLALAAMLAEQAGAGSPDRPSPSSADPLAP